jgi:hypothetical protein
MENETAYNNTELRILKKDKFSQMMKTVPFNQTFTTSFFQHTGSIKIEDFKQKISKTCPSARWLRLLPR